MSLHFFYGDKLFLDLWIKFDVFLMQAWNPNVRYLCEWSKLSPFDLVKKMVKLVWVLDKLWFLSGDIDLDLADASFSLFTSVKEIHHDIICTIKKSILYSDYV